MQVISQRKGGDKNSSRSDQGGAEITFFLGGAAAQETARERWGRTQRRRNRSGLGKVCRYERGGDKEDRSLGFRGGTRKRNHREKKRPSPERFIVIGPVAFLEVPVHSNDDSHLF